METRNCQNCTTSFMVQPDDFGFYTKMDVPPPTWCSSCRLFRRLSFLNWYNLYKRKCDRCQEDIVSTHHSDKPYQVYCQSCYWADDWDGTEYAMDYDPDRNFLEQVLELRNKSHFAALESLHTSLVNTKYANAIAYCKDSYMIFHADYVEKTAYSFLLAHIKESLDCYRAKSSELCYECIGINKCYLCSHSEELDACVGVHFSRTCFGCTDCVGCVNLRNKSYCIYNVQYSKEEYFEKVKEMELDTRQGREQVYKDALSFWQQHPYRATTGNNLNVNTTGDYVYESKNVREGYMITSTEDSKFVSFLTLGPTKDCYDYTVWGAGAEHLYECVTVGDGGYNNKFCMQCWPQALDNEYCMHAVQTNNCFGCVNLKRKNYCILNKQYSKEEYSVLKEQIIESMKNNLYTDSSGKTYSYGEFFPIEFSPYTYNESVVKDFFPFTKEDALEKHLSWYDKKENTYTITMQQHDLPTASNEVSEAITKEIMECSTCTLPYNITELEVYLLKKMNVPYPSSCWKCRQQRRFGRVNKPALFERNCQQCGTEVLTSYAPDRPEIIYCEKCYQQSVD